MKKWTIWAVAIVGTILFLGWMGWSLLSGDRQNKIERLGVAYLDGDYQVTYASDSFVKSWTVINGKVSTEAEKGYYFFWAKNAEGKKFYVQTPIERTFIEEIK